MRSIVVFAIASSCLCACDDSESLRAPVPELSRMQEQARLDPFDPGAMHAPQPDTVATNEALAAPPRPRFTHDLLVRGRTTFDVVCATCHGVLGDGDSVVADHMEIRRPASLYDARIRALSDDEIYEIIGSGYGLMPALAHEVPPDERWAVVAYVRALQHTLRTAASR